MADDPKALAAARLRERRERVRAIRRAVVAVAVAMFVALWGVIFTTLVTGRDPVLAAKAQSVGTTGSTGLTTASSGSTGSGSTSSASTSSGSSSSAGSNTSSVTTRQS